MHAPELCASILSADFARLADQVAEAEAGGATVVHCDLMDNHFVPNLTIGPPVVKAVRKVTKLPLDCHLMVENADSLIEPLADAGANWVCVHYEACPNLHRTLQLIKSQGKRAGVALNPATPASAIDPVLGDIDLVLVMSVNPGFGGQRFIASQLRKIEAIRKQIDKLGKPIDLEVDGGIDADTARQVIEAGADVLVAGTATFRGGPARYRDNIAGLRG